MEVIAVVSGVALAVAGWVVTQAQARRATRRNIRIEYLIATYRNLALASHRPLTPELAREMEAAIVDVQLLGTTRQVELAREFAKEMAAVGSAPADSLLHDLRASLRHELLLKPVTSNSFIVIIKPTIGT